MPHPSQSLPTLVEVTIGNPFDVPIELSIGLPDLLQLLVLSEKGNYLVSYVRASQTHCLLFGSPVTIRRPTIDAMSLYHSLKQGDLVMLAKLNQSSKNTVLCRARCFQHPSSSSPGALLLPPPLLHNGGRSGPQINKHTHTHTSKMNLTRHYCMLVTCSRWLF
jgi:hypothetical protein